MMSEATSVTVTGLAATMYSNVLATWSFLVSTFGTLTGTGIVICLAVGTWVIGKWSFKRIRDFFTGRRLATE